MSIGGPALGLYSQLENSALLQFRNMPWGDSDQREVSSSYLSSGLYKKYLIVDLSISLDPFLEEKNIQNIISSSKSFGCFGDQIIAI